ncbi:helix-turn-helix domain-containing protein [Longispora urticae]
MALEEFGTALRRMRDSAGLSQSQLLASGVHYTKSYLSKVETGARQPTADFARACDIALDAGGTLILLAELASVAASRAQKPHADIPDWDELLQQLDHRWHALVRVDNTDGPHSALHGVRQQLNLVARLLQQANGARRQEVLAIAARYAESAAWLCEDLGDLPAARSYVHQSMEWALEADDRPMLAWAMFRRAQQATTTGDAASVLGLIQAVLRQGDLPDAMRAAALQQSAAGHALAGNERACHAALDEAHRWAATPDHNGDAGGGHGSFCTPSYLEVQRGITWLSLGNPERSAVSIEAALPGLPESYQRDRGFALARLAEGQAASRQWERSADTAMAALQVARTTGSYRSMAAVRRVGHSLVEMRGAVPEVRAFLAVLVDGTTGAGG